MKFEYNAFSNYYTFYEPNLLYKDFLDPVRIQYGSFIISYLSLDFEQIQNDLYTFDLLFPLTSDLLKKYILGMFDYNSEIDAYYSQIKKIWDFNCKNKYLSLLMHEELRLSLFGFKKTPHNISEIFYSKKVHYKKLQDYLRNLFSGSQNDYFRFNDYESPSSTLEVHFSRSNNYPGIKTICLISNVTSLINFDLINISNHQIQIKKCANCGRFFIPSKRSDEIYCDRIYKNGKTCKDVGYSTKLKEDPFKSIFTTARKTQHARIRYNKHIKDYKEKHYEPWLKAASEARDHFSSINDIEGFKNWIENHKNAF